MEGTKKNATGSENTSASTSASVSTTTSTSTNAVTSNKEKKKREDKFRRRDPRALENIMKNCQAQDETNKLEVLSAKYNELYDDFRNSQNNLILTEKRNTTLQRERDQLQNEQSKSVLARSRMENLCRELQRQNKLIKEENIAKIREEEERRKEIAAKFQVTLSEVTLMMQESSEKNLRLRDDNIDMANKISALCEQFEKREEQLRKVSKQIELEKQLADAKVAKARIEYEAEKEKFNSEREILIKEKEVIKAMLQKSTEECTQLQMNSKSLQDQIQMYMGKYEEFETTICKSTRVFDNFKVEIGKTNKQIITLEKEIKMWKDRYQKTSETICEMTAVITCKENHITTLEKQVDQVTKLCRQIQLERSNYLQILRLNGIDPAFEKKGDETAVLTENGESVIQDEKKVQKKVKVQKPKLSAKDPLRQKEIKLAQLKEELFYIKKQCENELQKQNANVEDTRQTEVKLDAFNVEDSVPAPSVPVEIESNTSLSARLITDETNSYIEVSERAETPLEETRVQSNNSVDIVGECQRVVNDESVPEQPENVECEVGSNSSLLTSYVLSNVIEQGEIKQRLDTDNTIEQDELNDSIGSNINEVQKVDISKSVSEQSSCFEVKSSVSTPSLMPQATLSDIQVIKPIVMEEIDDVKMENQKSESQLIVELTPDTSLSHTKSELMMKSEEIVPEISEEKLETIFLGNILVAQENQHVCESQQSKETMTPKSLELEPTTSNEIDKSEKPIVDGSSTHADLQIDIDIDIVPKISDILKLQDESQSVFATANEAQVVNTQLTQSKTREECGDCGIKEDL